jgi:hypothetical protein
MLQCGAPQMLDPTYHTFQCNGKNFTMHTLVVYLFLAVEDAVFTMYKGKVTARVYTAKLRQLVANLVREEEGGEEEEEEEEEQEQGEEQQQQYK